MKLTFYFAKKKKWYLWLILSRTLQRETRTSGTHLVLWTIQKFWLLVVKCIVQISSMCQWPFIRETELIYAGKNKAGFVISRLTTGGSVFVLLFVVLFLLHFIPLTCSSVRSVLSFIISFYTKTSPSFHFVIDSSLIFVFCFCFLEIFPYSFSLDFPLSSLIAFNRNHVYYTANFKML